MRCPTVSGSFRCKHSLGHSGECETEVKGYADKISGTLLAQLYANNLLLTSVKDAAEELIKWAPGTEGYARGMTLLKLALKYCE